MAINEAVIGKIGYLKTQPRILKYKLSDVINE